jgi:hypothetical protein
MAAVTTPGPCSRIPAFAAGAVISIAIVKLLLHLYAARFYGYFGDELYFIACSDHLSWGYVDQPPLIAAIVKLERVLTGDSLQSIRLGGALAGAATVILGGMIARELGGRRFAQALTALAVLCAPLYLAMDHYISMNAFEPVFWMVCALLVLRFINTGNDQVWLWFGLVAGIGLNNEYSMAFFGGGIVLGLLLTPHRRVFLRPWIWLGGLIALGLIIAAGSRRRWLNYGAALRTGTRESGQEEVRGYANRPNQTMKPTAPPRRCLQRVCHDTLPWLICF